MAKRRMISTDIINTDAFHRMPRDAQLLYFNLCLAGDDDGFVANPLAMTAMLGMPKKNLKILADSGYLTLFDSGVCHIRDWRSHNYIRPDRYTPTRYQKEKESLASPPGETLPDAPRDIAHDIPDDIPRDIPRDIPNDIPRDIPLAGTGKDRVSKDRSGKEKEGESVCADRPPRAHFSPPSVDAVRAYCRERNNGIDPQRFVDYYTANGWSQGRGKPIRDWQAAVRTWERRDGDGRDDHGHGREAPAISGVLRL